MSSFLTYGFQCKQLWHRIQKFLRTSPWPYFQKLRLRLDAWVETLRFSEKLAFFKALGDVRRLNEKILMESLIQTYKMVQSTWLFYLVSGAALGVVLTLQTSYSLMDFRAEAKLPTFVTLPLLREFGPVLSAMFFAGIVGSAMVAETGLMQATEQLLSMELMGINPVDWVFLPRFLASLITLPLIMLAFILSGIFGSWAYASQGLGMDHALFTQTLWQEIAWLSELRMAIIKNLFFALIISGCSLGFGRFSAPHTEGVTRATIYGVTWSFMGVLLLNVGVDLATLSG